MEPYATEQGLGAYPRTQSTAKYIGYYSIKGKSYQVRFVDLASINQKKNVQADKLLSALLVASNLIKTQTVSLQDARSARIESELTQRLPGKRPERKASKASVVKNFESTSSTMTDTVPSHLATKINVLPRKHQHLAKNIIKNLKHLEKNKKINGMKFIKALKALDSILEQSPLLRENNLKALDKKCGGSPT